MRRVLAVLSPVLLLLLPAGSPRCQEQIPGEGKTIRKITIEGLRRTREAQILSRLRLRVGEPFDPRLAAREAGRLYAMGLFRRVSGPQVVELEDGVEVRFTVEEKPPVRAVTFRGRESLSEDDLLNEEPQLRTREGELFNRHWTVQDADAIRRKYVAEGYLFAEVDYEVIEEAGGVEVIFKIQEGPRVRIEEIEFVGNEHIDRGDLLGHMNTRAYDFWFFGLWHPGFFDYEVLEADLLTIRTYYRRFGFHDVRVGIDDIAFDPTMQWIRLTLRVEEGPQYVFRGYRFAGNAVFSEEVLRRLTSAQVGRPFNADAMERDIRAIEDYYGDRAYIFARVEPHFEYSPQGNDVHVRLDVREGNEIYIEHIKIRGNRRTQDRVVRRELEIYPGERVDRSKLTKSRSNLARLQIFNDIRYEYEPGSSPSYRDLVVEVDEAETGQLIVGVGITSGFGLLGNVSITKRNFDITDLPSSLYEIPERFTGAGQTLNLVAQPGTRRSFYRLTFIEPYLFNTRNSLTLSASSLDFLREDWEEGRATFAPRLGHAFDFDRDFQVSVGARIEDVEISDIDDDAPPDVFAVKGHTTVLALSSSVTYDKVLYEPLEGPYDGHEEGILYEYAGGVLGGDVDFHKLELSSAFYFPLYTHKPENLHHVISLRNAFGVIEPHDSDRPVPIFERFFLGGPFDVRGFRFRGLGPHVSGSPIGGTAEFHGSLEYGFPLFQKFLRGVVFFDYGNLAPELEDFSFSEMRYAVGGGVRINFPFFGQPLPIGLFLGTPVKKEPGDKPRLFLFTIGRPF